MTVAYVCVFISIFIPLVLAGYAKFGFKGYNNRKPREFMEKLEGRHKRAHYAQMNSYEAFPPFVRQIVDNLTRSRQKSKISDGRQGSSSRITQALFRHRLISWRFVSSSSASCTASVMFMIGRTGVLWFGPWLSCASSDCS